jgi:hypothetical protein
MLPGQLNPAFILDAPAGHHFNTAPWNYPSFPYDHPTNTGTQWGDGPLTPYPANVVDWILVTVRKNGILPANNVWRCAGWVMKDGSVVFPENCALPAMNWGTDTYYIMVEHRNHLGVLAQYDDIPPVMFGVNMPCGTAVLDWDFTLQDSYKPVFRFGQKEVEPGTWAMIAANGDQVLSISSINSTDRTLWITYQGLSGYYPSDYNMNGNSNSVDETLWKINQNKTSGIIFY